MRSVMCTVVLLCACSDGNACKALIACDSGAEFDLATISQADIGRLTGATVEACLNASCVSGAVLVPPPNDMKETGLTANGTDPIVYLEAWRTAADGSIGLQVYWLGMDADRFKDGDKYSLRLIAADGSDLTSQSWIATYSDRFPNGPDCGVCRQAGPLTPAS